MAQPIHSHDEVGVALAQLEAQTVDLDACRTQVEGLLGQLRELRVDLAEVLEVLRGDG